MGRRFFQRFIYSRGSAFVATTDDRNVITWGYPSYGGDSSKVSHLLNQNNIETIFSTNQAFTAVTADGTVITWGDKTESGDSSSVSNILNENTIETIYHNNHTCMTTYLHYPFGIIPL